MTNNTKYKSNIEYSFLKALGYGGALLFTTACSNYHRAAMDDQSLPSKVSKRRNGTDCQSDINSQSPPKKVCRSTDDVADNSNTRLPIQDSLSLLERAVRNNKQEEVKRVLDNYPCLRYSLGKTYTFKVLKDNINISVKNETLLMLAVRRNNLEITKLLEGGSNINHLNGSYETVLHIAIDRFR